MLNALASGKCPLLSSVTVQCGYFQLQTLLTCLTNHTHLRHVDCVLYDDVWQGHEKQIVELLATHPLLESFNVRPGYRGPHNVIKQLSPLQLSKSIPRSMALPLASDDLFASFSFPSLHLLSLTYDGVHLSSIAHVFTACLVLQCLLIKPP